MNRPSAFRGRGSAIDPPNRFEPIALELLPERLEEIAVESSVGGGGRRVSTRVFHDRAKSIINPVNSPDLGFAWTINPYRGCEHGCVYCYARPTHETFGLSCGLDFETRLFAKVDAPRLLLAELSKPAWTGEPIVISGITDPYQPIERELRITRACLEVIAECRQPVSLVTKSRMITRDLDLLAPLAAHGAAHAGVSVTTLDPDLARRMEPRASAPRDRLRAIEDLASAGVPVTAMLSPIIPGINDREIPAILAAAKDAGARAATWVMLRLPWGVKDVFTEWLEREFPDRAAKVEGFIRSMRDGRLNDARPGSRMRGEGVMAAQIKRLFEVHATRAGLDGELPALNRGAFRRPRVDGAGQMGLWG